MARNRQRAKDRKRRQAADDGPAGSEVEETTDPVVDARAEDDEPLDAEPVEDLDDDDSDEDDELALEAGGDGGGGDEPPAVSVAKRDRGGEPDRSKKQGVLKRSGAFLRASWAELQRVQWPDRQQVFQATAVVLGFVVIAGAFLGLADQVAQEVVDAIL